VSGAQPPFASVIIPTRGRVRTLLRALASLQAQELPAWEAIVVDDGDGEATAAVTEIADSRIRVLANVGTGQVDARNTAIVHARGEWLCWLDDDDWWQDELHLAVLHEAMLERSFAFRGGWIVFEDDPQSPGRREVFDHDATMATLAHDNTVLTSSIAYPRCAHRELGLLDRELGGYCDWDFMLRLGAAGFAPHKLPGLSVCYAIHATNTSAEAAAPARRRGFERFAAKHALEIRIANHLEIHTLLSDAGDSGGLE
jgi:glycosyltransferase involved in cell wall biosynthesis